MKTWIKKQNKKTSWKRTESQKRYCFSSAFHEPDSRQSETWTSSIHPSFHLSPSPPQKHFLCRAPRSLGSALCVVVDRVRNSHVQFLFLTCYLVRKHTNISCSCYPGNQLSLNTKQHASSPETDCIKRMYMHQSSEEHQLDIPLTTEGTPQQYTITMI